MHRGLPCGHGYAKLTTSDHALCIQLNPLPDFRMPPHSKPGAVVFDLDGLIVNTEELYQDVGGEILRRRGKSFSPDLLDAMMGRPGQRRAAIDDRLAHARQHGRGVGRRNR